MEVPPTMANYRSVHVKIWSDPIIENLPANARYVFIYLITCPARNESALYDITWKRIAQDTGLTISQVAKAIGVLVETRRIMYDEETATVWVINAVKHQALNDNCRKSIFTDLERCSSPSLATSFASFYTDFKGYQTHAHGLPNPPIGIGTGYRDRVQGEIGIEKILPESSVLPINGDGTDFDAFLLQQWGKEGHLSYALMEAFRLLAKTHGWDRVRYAVSEAANHGAKNIAYVKGVLEPKSSKEKFDKEFERLAKEKGMK